MLDWAQGGGGLDVRRQLPTPAFPETLLHVSASSDHLLHIADSMQLRKEDKEGFMRPYCKEEDDAFPGSGRVGPLHLADVHRCVQHAMDRVHFGSDIRSLPGHDDRAVMRGAPVLSSYQERRLITVFPLHDDEDLERLYKQWNTFSPPLEGIRNYFGESVALYWSFAETYTRFLTLVAVLGATEYFCEYHGINYIYSNLLFGLFNLVCLAIFFEVLRVFSPPIPSYRPQTSPTFPPTLFFTSSSPLSPPPPYSPLPSSPQSPISPLLIPIIRFPSFSSASPPPPPPPPGVEEKGKRPQFLLGHLGQAEEEAASA